MTKDYRRCVSCRKIAHRSEFWRVMKCYPSNQIIIDRGNIFIQGRSAYLCQTASCLQIARKKIGWVDLSKHKYAMIFINS